MKAKYWVDYIVSLAQKTILIQQKKGLCYVEARLMYGIYDLVITVTLGETPKHFLIRKPR